MSTAWIGQTWQQRTSRRPEWWLLILSTIAWVALVTPHGGGVHGYSVGHAHLDSGAVAAENIDSGVTIWTREFREWSLMAIAMMTPLVIGEVRATANRSLWRRRERAISGFLTGFLGAWFLVGLFIATLASTLEIAGWWNFQWLGALGFAGAAGWQLTSRKKRALWSCHRTMPLSPDGWRADVDCIRYGWDIGQTCVASCWAMMLACALTAHGLIAMLCVGTLAGVERYGVRPRFSSVAVSLTGLALVYATLGLSGGQAL